MRTRALITFALPLILVGEAFGHPPARRPLLRIGGFSSQLSANRAVAGARISAGSSSADAARSPAPPAASGQAAAGDTVVVPTLSADSPLLQDPAPAGPGSLWYQGSPGESCIYLPNASPACYQILPPGAGAPPDLASLAAGLAERLDLSLPAIEASPAADQDGLTGAASWFWLAVSPSEQQRSITLAGETVTVSADPGAIRWSFGDGGGLEGGAGTPYQTGVASADAVTHLYATRCLPGDQGHDPYVLASCGPDGYHVDASTTWTISFTATGPVSESGQLASRGTETELVYPVSEARAFLTGTAG